MTTRPPELLTSPIPPHSLEAERAVLGAILLERESLPKAVEILKPADFYKEGHRRIFATMIDLFKRSEPVDLLTLSEELRRSGELDEVGGPAALASLVEEAATAAHLLSYAGIVLDHATKRDVIRLGLELQARATNGARAPELLVHLSTALGILSRRHQPMAPVEALLESGALLAKEFLEAPAIVDGGILPRAALMILGGPPKVGKSSLALNLALRRSLGKAWLGFPTVAGKTLVVQAEIPERELQTRFRVMLEDFDALPPETVFFVSRRGLYLDDPAGRLACRRWLEALRPDLLIVDPLARFYAGDENSSKDMSRLIAGLDELIQEFAVTIVLIHHTTKPALGDPREGGQRLRGSSVLFAAADSVLLLDRAEGGVFKLGIELRHGREPEPLLLMS